MAPEPAQRPETMTLESLDDLIKIPPFHSYLGIKVLHAEEGRVVLQIPPKEEFVGDPTVPAIHGGIIASLIDLAGGAALFVTTLWPTPTIDMRVDFLKPAIAGRALTAEARVKQLGKLIGFVDVDVKDEQGRLVAQGRCTYHVRKREAERGRAYPIG